jgi:hypothetical protein
MTLTLATEMVRLAKDGAMFKIARFEKQFRYTSGPSRNPRIACDEARPASLSASQKFFLTYADARNLRRCYWNRSTEAQL